LFDIVTDEILRTDFKKKIQVKMAKYQEWPLFNDIDI